MALSDLKVFSEQAYTTAVELLAWQIDKFNDASAGALVLGASSHMGDFSETAMFGLLDGIVRRRNPYGADSTLGEIAMRNISDVSVKVAAGSNPVRIDPAWYNWIKVNPSDAAGAFGKQLAQQMLEDMIKVGVSTVSAAMVNNSMLYDGTQKASKSATWQGLQRAAQLMGDRSSDIVAWVMQSASATDLLVKGLDNVEKLFTYGTVNVVRDPIGRLCVITDNPGLYTAGTTGDNAVAAKYAVLGLVPGAVIVGQNDDFFANEDARNGSENIKVTYQAEWSYQLALKGYAWDRTNGGKAPTDAALNTGTNWDKYVSDNKNTAGVIAQFNGATDDY